MSQPLITRPAYGNSHSNTPVAVSGLPQGGPADKGLPLDSGIPGTSTFNKPEEDIREQAKDDEPIKRVDDADDLLKNRNRVDVREDNADKHDGIGAYGNGDWTDSSKSKYPYRDGIPNTHSASKHVVLGMWLLQTAPEVTVSLESVKTAATIEDILSGLSDKVKTRAQKCSVKLKRADVPNLRWIFLVDAGNGPKVVRMKATRKSPKTLDVSKMDVKFSCSCPAWRWWGAEHASKRDEYLEGKLVGTGGPPDIRDPDRVNKLCKHVTAVVELAKNYRIPVR
jgi:hypothetical protein